VVQLIIDRLIFLRIAEDRGVETYGELKTSINQKGEVYQNLLYNFRKADEKYNSGLFDFKKDTISEKLLIDNKVIRSIVNEMYYPESPYEFSVISVEILGSAYEQFLGKVIRITPAHHAKIEEKPEVRKAGGVYYTPQYVVEYIVKNTVGKLIEGKTPDQISQLKICDPACGSGSFLIGAYQYLLEYHHKFYTKDAINRGKKDCPLNPDGHLTSTEKKRILLNNIFGVDIDVNAVEVTKLSLLLKCMEGENENTITQQQKLWHERILPSLDNNIKSGNSLVDTDFYAGELDFGEEKKIKPFNWQKAFPEVFYIKKSSVSQEFKNQFVKVKSLSDDTDELIKKYWVNEPSIDYGDSAGFDVVLGNPPYGALLKQEVDNYLRNKYQVANYQLDTYNLFLERGKKLLKANGFLGYIIPSAWVASKYDNKFRRYLVEETKIENFVITPKQTFKQANVETCIIIVCNNNPSPGFLVERWDLKNKTIYSLKTNEIKQETNFVFPVYSNEKTNQLIKKIRHQKFVLSDIANVIWGIKVYETGKGTPPQNSNDSNEKTFHSIQKTKETQRPLLGGSEISRYLIKWKGGYLDYGKWLAEPRQPHWFEGERILVREVTANGIIQATYVKDNYVFSNSVDGIKPKTDNLRIKFLLGVINSRVISFYHSKTSANAFKGTFPKVLIQDLKNLPFPDATDAIQLEIENLVNTLLLLKEENQKQILPERLEFNKSKIDFCEDRINHIVYQLYNLTNEEVKIIEGE
jgi:type I restriction-modification system DNA methylase subunit